MNHLESVNADSGGVHVNPYLRLATTFKNCCVLLSVAVNN